MRLDVLVAQKFGHSRNKAQQFIEAGLVEVRKGIITKVSFDVAEVEEITLLEDKSIAWVSRSAGKLDDFLETLARVDIDFHMQDVL